MTEIPEHLLKRSQARRAAASGAETTAAETTPAQQSPAAAPAAPASTGAVTRADAPEPAAAPAPKPDSAVVAAYKARRRVPAWAMMGLALLPVWGFMYLKAITPQAVEPTGPLAVGAATYAGSCASCHGASGQGGAGRQLSDGEVLKTFPHIEDQLRYVYFGTDKYNAAGVEIPGDPNREGGPHITGAFGPMPGWGGNLTDAQILGAVCDERYAIGGADPASDQYADEYALWCADDSPAYEALEGGEATLPTLHEALGPDAAIIPIGDAPAAGSSAS